MVRNTLKVLAGAALIAVASTASAQGSISNRFTPIRSVALPADTTENHCLIKVWVDDIATVRLNRDQVEIATDRGRTARDQGTECTGPLPRNRTVDDFRLVRANQPRVSIEQAPDATNEYTAQISLSDPAPGARYFELLVAWNDPGRGGRYALAERYGNGASSYGNGYASSTLSSVDEEAACQQRVLDELRTRNGDDSIAIDFRPNIRREDVTDRRVRIRGNALASGPNVDEARITYECLVNERNNRVVTASYTVRSREYR